MADHDSSLLPGNLRVCCNSGYACLEQQGQCVSLCRSFLLYLLVRISSDVESDAAGC